MRDTCFSMTFLPHRNSNSLVTDKQINNNNNNINLIVNKQYKIINKISFGTHHQFHC